ncbi:ATP-binding protein [Gymnodinialimonas hymeniacidonis]|uniref:ATP-binding protein n=1 Tax=Gymnodinialimonas hymeniacidonis TaxID=3126508 RepID=UPI0034C6CE49
MARPDLVTTLSSETDHVRRALDDVRDKLNEMPEFQAIGDTTQIILAEVLNNVVEHAYRFQPGHPIEVTLSFAEEALNCRVVDQGVAMPKGKPPNGGMPEIDPNSPDDLPEGGFGWAMIHMMTDGLSYTRKDGCNELFFSIPNTLN